MLVSVIIPTLNDAALLPQTLRPLAGHPHVELIVVDGGSMDASVTTALQFTPFVFVCAAGRAARMNLGARHATGDILLFLLPGMRLVPGAIEAMQRRLVGAGAVGGAFDWQVDSLRWIERWLVRLVSRRARVAQLPRAEQGLFVWRQVFELLGGFPDLPILEDLAFARRLRRVGRLTFLPHGLISSAHRWQEHGLVKTLLVNAWVQLLYTLGVPPVQLRRISDGWLPPQPAARVAAPSSLPNHKPPVRG